MKLQWARCVALAGVLSAGCLVSGRSAPESAALLLSRLQAMAHGQHSASEWNEVIEDVHAMIAAQEARDDVEGMIDTTVVLSQIYSDMLGDSGRAEQVLKEMKGYAEERKAAGVAKVNVRLAQVYAIDGRSSEIEALIEEFRTGPFYDPLDYRVEGGEAPGIAVRIQRPAGAGDNSVTVTSMEHALREARFAPGRTFPPLRAVDDRGRKINLTDLRGRVVLVDFWHPQWTAWKRDVGTLQSMYREYGTRGFEIIGIGLEQDKDARARAIADYNLSWPQTPATPDLLKRCGVAGDAGNFLIGPDGRILGRNLYGSDLRAMVEQALNH